MHNILIWDKYETSIEYLWSRKKSEFTNSVAVIYCIYCPANCKNSVFWTFYGLIKINVRLQVRCVWQPSKRSLNSFMRIIPIDIVGFKRTHIGNARSNQPCVFVYQ